MNEFVKLLNICTHEMATLLGDVIWVGIKFCKAIKSTCNCSTLLSLAVLIWLPDKLPGTIPYGKRLIKIRHFPCTYPTCCAQAIQKCALYAEISPRTTLVHKQFSEFLLTVEKPNNRLRLFIESQIITNGKSCSQAHNWSSQQKLSDTSSCQAYFKSRPRLFTQSHAFLCTEKIIMFTDPCTGNKDSRLGYNIINW